MLLLIDNYDSFTYNLVQYFSELGQKVAVYRNDVISLTEIENLSPTYVVIGPGPCAPEEAGVSIACIKELGGKVPILGICLGHQSIAAAFGGKIVPAKTLNHGISTAIHHDGEGVFYDLPSPINGMRYHSLVASREELPQCLKITAWSEDNDIMGVRHVSLPIEGIQFHPESFLSEYGYAILKNFLRCSPIQS